MSSNEKVWLVTAAGRGLGADIVAMQPIEANAHALFAQIDTHRALSASLVTDRQGD